MINIREFKLAILKNLSSILVIKHCIILNRNICLESLYAFQGFFIFNQVITIIVEAGIVTISDHIPDTIEPDILKDKSDEIKNKYGEMVTNAIEDPFSILESLGQDVTDTMEEEGIMYMIGNVSTSLIPY